jgi:hypothetical protein
MHERFVRVCEALLVRVAEPAGTGKAYKVFITPVRVVVVVLAVWTLTSVRLPCEG